MIYRLKCAGQILALGILAIASLAFASSPTSGTLNSTSGSSTTWTGSAAAATNGESTCVDGTNCDVYTLSLSGTTAGYAGKYVTIKLTWPVSADEYDLYIHKGGLTGPVVASATSGPLIGSQIVTLTPASTGAGVYTVHIVASNVTPGDTYKGVASVGTTPPPPPVANFTAPTYQNDHSPAGIGDNSGEPSIGANWKSGRIMTNAVLDTIRVSINTATSPATLTWKLVDSPITSTTSLDPILFHRLCDGADIRLAASGDDEPGGFHRRRWRNLHAQPGRRYCIRSGPSDRWRGSVQGMHSVTGAVESRAMCGVASARTADQLSARNLLCLAGHWGGANGVEPKWRLDV